MVSGWMCLSYIQDQQQHQHPQPPATVLDDKSSRPKSREEMRLQAMVENALKSSWQENLSNAFDAQERFMLPGRDHGGDPKFLKKIDKKADEMLKKQTKRQKKKEALAKEREESFYTVPPALEESRQQEEGKTKIQFWGSGK